VIKSFYQAGDVAVGQLLEGIGEETTVFVMSDHGFGPLDRRFFLNNWLIEQGYLKLLPVEKQPRRTQRRLAGRLAAPVFWLNRRSRQVRWLLAPLKRGQFADRLKRDYLSSQAVLPFMHAPVDWEGTRAYCFAPELLAINLGGREPMGIVSPGEEFERLRQELMERLDGIVDPSTGTPIRIRTSRWEDIYTGEKGDPAPDIILSSMDDGRCLPRAALYPGSLFDDSPTRSGNHRPDGLLIAWGKHVREGGPVEANLMDLAPTILHLLDLPVPQDMDGQVMKHLLQPESPPARAPIRSGPPATRQRQAYQWNQEELDEVEERLRGLGYID
jgi:predicted AlkP superfamily phosphohydrolase/phosphomutase